MITLETAQEIVDQSENLYLVNQLQKLAQNHTKNKISISIVGIRQDQVDEEYCINPPPNLLLPFLNEYEKYVRELLKKANVKVREELTNDN